MRRTERLQGLRLMKFQEVYERTCLDVLSQGEAAEILGMSERTFRRWRDRFPAEGAEGLYDRRLGRVTYPILGGGFRPASLTARRMVLSFKSESTIRMAHATR